MDKKEALSKFKSNPKVEKLLEFIRDDKNWVYDLFDVIKIRVDHFFKLSYFKNEELKQELTLYIFGNMLLTIADDERNRFLTSMYPRRVPFKTEAEKRAQKGADLGGKYIIALYDVRRLVKNEINLEINKYIQIANIFIQWMKVDESLVWSELISLFKERNKLEEALEFLFTKVIFSTPKSFGNTNKDDSNKQRPGPIPKYDSKESLIEAIKSIPKTEYKSRTKLAELLGMTESNLRELEKKYDFHYTKI